MSEAPAQRSSGSPWHRLGAAAGIPFVGLYAIAIAMVGDFPEASDPAEEFAAYYVDDRGTYIAASLLVLAAFGLFIWFTIALSSRLRNGGETGVASAIAISGATYVAVSLASLGIGLGLVANEAGREVDPSFLKAIEAAADGIWMLGWLPLAVFMLSFGIGAVRRGIAPSWFGPASAVAAAILALGTTTWSESGFWSPFGGFVVFIAAAILLWPLLASVLMLRAKPIGERS